MHLKNLLFCLILTLTIGCDDLNSILDGNELNTNNSNIVVNSTPTVIPTIILQQPTVVPSTVPEEVKPDKLQPNTPVIKLKCSEFIDGQDGSGGFVNNPNSEKGTLKIILPERYTDKIVEVVIWNKETNFLERLQNKQPNEYNNRERYYGKTPISKYPKNLVVGFRLLKGKVICVKVPNPQERLD